MRSKCSLRNLKISCGQPNFSSLNTVLLPLRATTFIEARLSQKAKARRKMSSENFCNALPLNALKRAEIMHGQDGKTRQGPTTNNYARQEVSHGVWGAIVSPSNRKSTREWQKR